MAEDLQKMAQFVWAKCLSYIKNNTDEQAYNTWFAPIVPIRLENNTLYIMVPSNFFFEWLEEHYIELIRSAITRELGSSAQLMYEIKSEHTSNKTKPETVQLPSSQKTYIKTQELNVSVEQKAPEIKNPFIIPGIISNTIDSQLNSAYNFNNFLEGNSNRLARNAGKAVSEKPGGTSFNPFMIYGGVGLGKTHLAHAIGIEIKEKYPDKTVLYVSSEVFTSQYLEAVQRKNINNFIYFYQLIDVLIIDDIQFFSGKDKTQEAFFHIFNHLQQNGKQIILTSDKAPVEMKDIEQRLLSRFKWGLSAEIQAPDFATRVSILNNILHKDGIKMPKEVVEYVAKNIKTNIRELEGALISLVAHSSFNHQEINLDLAKSIVEKFVTNSQKELSIDYIKQVTADYFKISLSDMESSTRKRNIVQARQLAMYFAKKYTKQSLSNIGLQIGGRDHATVLHACKTVENLNESDKQFKIFVSDLKKYFI